MENIQHEKFMRMAIRLSEQNVLQNLGGPFGAVVVKDGKVIAKSANKVTTSNDPTAHAEVSAIRLACKKLKTFDLTGGRGWKPFITAIQRQTLQQLTLMINLSMMN